MLKQLFNVFMGELDKHLKKGSNIENRILQIEEEYAEALADAERWGDLTDKSHWRTVEANRIKRVIESKRRMIDTLKQHS